MLKNPLVNNLLDFKSFHMWSFHVSSIYFWHIWYHDCLFFYFILRDSQNYILYHQIFIQYKWNNEIDPNLKYIMPYLLMQVTQYQQFWVYLRLSNVYVVPPNSCPLQQQQHAITTHHSSYDDDEYIPSSIHLLIFQDVLI